MDKIVPQIIVYTNYSELFEKMLKNVLKNYYYRGEFYECNIKIITTKINEIINFFEKSLDDFIFEKHIIKNKNNTVINHTKNKISKINKKSKILKKQKTSKK